MIIHPVQCLIFFVVNFKGVELQKKKKKKKKKKEEDI
jgi:hypothetical protein